MSKKTNFFLQFLFQTPVQFWIGWQFYKGAWATLKHKTTDMNTLIAVGTTAAYGYSVLATFFPSFFAGQGLAPEVYFDTAGAIIVIILLGRLLEARAKGRTSEAIKKLLGLQPKTAIIIREKQEFRNFGRGCPDWRYCYRASGRKNTGGWHSCGRLFLGG